MLSYGLYIGIYTPVMLNSRFDGNLPFLRKKLPHLWELNLEKKCVEKKRESL